MSEIKRVVFSTLDPPKVSDKTIKRVCKTIRISVKLPESNEDTCPVFNYKDELAVVKRKDKDKQNGKTAPVANGLENGLDPFCDDDDDVRRIALEMEAKYGTVTAGPKKKRKGRKDDYADIGMGYDESDSFIDNTDGYDEIIPKNVTTLHGGFYINSGALEFKTDDEASSDATASSSEDGSDDEEKPKRKRVLDSSDDSDDGDVATKPTDKDPKAGLPKNSMQQAIKKKLFSQQKIQVKKRRLMDPSKKTVKDLLREKRHDLDMTVGEDLQDAEVKNGNVEKEKDYPKENKNINSITDAIEAVIKQTEKKSVPVVPENANKTITESKKDTSISKPVAVDSGEGESSREGAKNETFEVVELPENLPSDTVEIVNKLKMCAIEYKDAGKVKFFTGQVNDLLLSLERKCKCLGKSSRLKIYAHLSPFIKCKKETLIRRAKSLVFENDELKLKKLVMNLKTQIDEVMPAQIRNHEKECQKVLQKKFSQEAVENEELKQLKNPRRRFHCPDEMKKLLREILVLKRKCLIAETKKKDTTTQLQEEQLSLYLKQNILPLWPDGWMSVGSLTRLCNNVAKLPSNTKNTNLNSSSTSQNNKHSPSNTAALNTFSITPIVSSVTNNNVVPMLQPHDIVNNVLTSQKLPESIIKTSVSYLKDKPKPDKIVDKSPKPDNSVIVVNTSKIKNDNTVIPSKSTQPHCQNIKTINLTAEPSKSKFSSMEATAKSLDMTKYPVSASKTINLTTEPSKPKFSSIEATIKSLDMTKYPVSTPKTINLTTEPSKPKFSSIEPTSKSLDITKYPVSTSKTINLCAEPSKSKYNSMEPTAKSLDMTKYPMSTKTTPKTEGDDIQMVMENLKALQKMSSPHKTESTNSSPVSVISFNKNSNASHSSELSPKDFSAGFQDEFQKQFIGSLSHLNNTSISSKPNYRCS